nr:MAG TPA: protein of unknown function (DUF5489) [Caudoviricetes sp.]
MCIKAHALLYNCSKRIPAIKAGIWELFALIFEKW